MGFITYFGAEQTVFMAGSLTGRLILSILLGDTEFEETQKQVFFLKDSKAFLFGIYGIYNGVAANICADDAHEQKAQLGKDALTNPRETLRRRPSARSGLALRGFSQRTYREFSG